MTKKNYFAIVLSVIMAFSAFTVVDAFCSGTIVAYAAGISAPSVTASNKSYKSIKLSWKKVKGSKKYIVSRSSKKNSGYKTVATVTKNTYTDTKVKCSKTYYYKVTAVSSSTRKSSKPVKIKCTPSAPSGASAVSTKCGKITIKFKKVSGANGYNIAYCDTAKGKFVSIGTVKSTSFTHNIGVGKKGYYKVRAYRTVNGKKIYSPYSKMASALAASHSFGNYTVDVMPTCALEGKKHTICSACGFTEYKAMEATGEHRYSAYVVTLPARCTQAGEEAATCQYCGKIKTRAIKAKGHNYTNTVVKATCTQQGYTKHTCTSCGLEYADSYISAIGHNYVHKTVPVTCTDDGFTGDVCANCGDVINKTDVVVSNKTEHIYPDEYSLSAEGYRVYTCELCGFEKIDTTCYIDLTARTVSVPAVASFGVSATTGKDKLDLNFDGVSNYEITGSAANITIDVNAADDCEVKLAGVTITNDATDCIDIKNKCTTLDPATGEPIIPTVTISAKVDTVNTLSSTTSGNAIESSCKLEFKGRGSLNCNTASTAISATAKITIKNLTLSITSTGNRGIDTKEEIIGDIIDPTDPTGSTIIQGVADTEFYNIEIGANAKITVNSYDDGIRCKNFETTYIDTAIGDVDSVINISSQIGDGIQLEGNGTNRAPLTLHSGITTVSGGKSPINNKSGVAMVMDGTAKLYGI